MEFLLFPIFGFIVFAIVFFSIATARRKAAAEQQNQQRIHEQDTAQAHSDVPVRPVTRMQHTHAAAKTNRQEDKTEAISKDDHLQIVQLHSSQADQKSILSFSGNEAVKGILYSEILGKPKSLR